MADSRLAIELLSQIGTCRPQSSTEWSGNFPLPPDILQFYQEVGPDSIMIEEHGYECFIPSLNRLADYQVGYRFHPKTGLRFPEWHDEWIVVADLGADPLISSGGAILHDQHGRGEWSPSPMFDNIYEMAASLATVGIAIQEASLNSTDDDLSLAPEYREIAINRLVNISGNHLRANAIIESFGWR